MKHTSSELVHHVSKSIRMPRSTRILSENTHGTVILEVIPFITEFRKQACLREWSRNQYLQPCSLPPPLPRILPVKGNLVSHKFDFGNDASAELRLSSACISSAVIYLSNSLLEFPVIVLNLNRKLNGLNHKCKCVHEMGLWKRPSQYI